MKFFPALMFAAIFLCGISIGLFVGQKTAPCIEGSGYCVPASGDELDTFYTSILGVTDSQKKQLAPIETEYLKQKAVYSEQMAKANIRLAEIIEEKGYGDEAVAQAVMNIHGPMGDLQHLTLQHLAQIRSVLTDEQAELLKAHVVERLRLNQ